MKANVIKKLIFIQAGYMGTEAVACLILSILFVYKNNEAPVYVYQTTTTTTMAPTTPKKIEMDYYQLKCKPGTFLSYCGTQGLDPVDDAFSVYQYSVPLDITSCRCYGDETKCRPWCRVKQDSGYEVMKTYGYAGDHILSCSDNHKKVIGCYMYLKDVNDTTINGAYPHDEGSCMCRFKGFGVCFTACAEGLEGYEIKKVQGHGNITVSCSAGKSVRGCAINPYGTCYHFRSVFALNETSCMCIDRCSATCFAMCAK